MFHLGAATPAFARRYSLEMDPAIEQCIQESIARNNHDLLNNMAALIEDKLTGFKRASDASSQQQLSEIKKLRFSEQQQLKKKANRDQYYHNMKVLDALESSQTSLAENKLEATAENIQQGMALVEERQKLILVADQSPYGWLTVHNYKSNAFAKDEKDEKRLQRAENRAAQESKRRNASKRFKNNEARRRQETTTTPAPTRKSGSCFACGKPGHWKFEYHLFQQASTISANQG